MGYEVKIHMGYHWSHELKVIADNKKAVKEDKKKEKDVRLYAHFHEIVVIDIAKPGYDTAFYRMLTKAKEDENPLYAALASHKSTGCECECNSCGQDAIIEDRYGERLIHLSLPMVYRAIMADEVDIGKYRRYQIVLDIFKTLKTQFKAEDEMVRKKHNMSGLTCVLYGH